MLCASRPENDQERRQERRRAACEGVGGAPTRGIEVFSHKCPSSSSSSFSATLS